MPVINQPRFIQLRVKFSSPFGEVKLFGLGPWLLKRYRGIFVPWDEDWMMRDVDFQPLGPHIPGSLYGKLTMNGGSDYWEFVESPLIYVPGSKLPMLGMVIPPLIRILISWGPINPYGLGLMSLSPYSMEITGVDRPDSHVYIGRS